MATFPRREAEIINLARSIISGMTANATDFQTPPVTAAELQETLDAFIALGHAQTAAHAAAQLSTEAKQAGFEVLVAKMKAALRYAEITMNGNDAKLTALGWGSRADAAPLAPPGQPGALEAARLGAGRLSLEWKKPMDGGATAFYKVERRELPSGEWILTGTAFDTEVILKNQERGKEWEYRIIALNRAGESAPSNIVAAVL